MMDEEIASSPDSFTPWLKMEWSQITSRYLDDILDGNDSPIAVLKNQSQSTT
jgi:hypothetical protein